MKDLEKEAERYIKRKEYFGSYNGNSLSPEDRYDMNIFIAGANSKYVKRKIIQAKIDVLEELGYREEDSEHLVELIQELSSL